MGRIRKGLFAPALEVAAGALHRSARAACLHACLHVCVPPVVPALAGMFGSIAP
jgi:hypothetical protein